jgi:hypothetical protein
MIPKVLDSSPKMQKPNLGGRAGSNDIPITIRFFFFTAMIYLFTGISWLRHPHDFCSLARSSRFNTFPAAFRGSAETKSKDLGSLYPARFSLQ